MPIAPVSPLKSATHPAHKKSMPGLCYGFVPAASPGMVLNSSAGLPMLPLGATASRAMLPGGIDNFSPAFVAKPTDPSFAFALSPTVLNQPISPASVPAKTDSFYRAASSVQKTVQASVAQPVQWIKPLGSTVGTMGETVGSTLQTTVFPTVETVGTHVGRLMPSSYYERVDKVAKIARLLNPFNWGKDELALRNPDAFDGVYSLLSFVLFGRL